MPYWNMDIANKERKANHIKCMKHANSTTYDINLFDILPVVCVFSNLKSKNLFNFSNTKMCFYSKMNNAVDVWGDDN